MTAPVFLSRDGHVASIILNRPEQSNAIDPALSQALIDSIEEVVADTTIRAVVLRATGKYFCVGGSIAFLDQAGADLPRVLEKFLGPLHAAINKLLTLHAPVISAINGPVGGAGIGLALCADVVLAAESMKLQGGYSAIGLTPDEGAFWLLARRAGPARAKQIFLTNAPLSARQCLKFGIVDEILPDDALTAHSASLAQTLSEEATGALGRIKRLTDATHQRLPGAPLHKGHRLMVESAASIHAAEGLVALREKRFPVARKDCLSRDICSVL